MSELDASSLNGGRPHVSSEDVARAAGVSRATVSYVLNRTPGRRISEATRARVLATAERLGHVPHASARSLRLGRSNVVLALISDFTFGYIRDQTLQALDTAMSERGYVLLVHRYLEDKRPMSELWRVVWPDVMLTMAGVSLRKSITTWNAHTKLIEVQSLMDQSQAGAMQVEYLASKGHLNLGYAYPSNTNVRTIADERLEGTREACRRLELPEPIVRSVDRNDLTTINSALDAWAAAGNVTAVCAHNDEIAAMLCLALGARGLVVGKDLAVIGIDGIPISQLGITTVAIDIQQTTARIVEHVVAALEERPPRVSRKPVLRLITRDSA